MKPQIDIPQIYKISKEFKDILFSYTIYLFEKFFIKDFSLENLKSLNIWEQIKGAKKPVRKTSASIF